MQNSTFRVIRTLKILLLIVSSQYCFSQACAFSSCFDDDCGNLNVGFTPDGGPQFCEGDTIILFNSSAPGFDFFVVDWKDGTVDTIYSYANIAHVYTIPDSLVCEGSSVRPFSLCFKGQKSCQQGLSCQSGTYDFGIRVRPKAQFVIPNELCISTPYQFNNTSCNGATYQWDFGDGTTSTEVNPSHIYSSTGFFTVTLITINQCGQDSFTRNIEVVGEPLADFDFSISGGGNFCAPTILNFINQSNLNWSNTTWSISPVDSTKWQFTDTLMNFQSENISIEFLQEGTYIITISATNACGTDTFTEEIIIYEEPVITYNSPDPSCNDITFSPSSIQFNISGESPGTTYSWTFVNGSVPSAQGLNFPPVLFQQSGQITLNISTACGDIMIEFPIVIVNEEVAISTNPGSVCQGSGSLQLSATPLGGIWSGPGIIDPIAGIFDPSGLQGGQIYDITYSINLADCSKEGDIQIEVLESASVSFTPPIVCIDNNPITLTANPSGGTWSGIGITNTTQGIFDPTVSGIGSFEITYGITDSNQCQISVTENIIVEALPLLEFSDTVLMCISNIDTSLTNLLQYEPNPGGGVTIWQGPGVDPVTGTFNPETSQLTPGTYTIYIEYIRNNCAVFDSTMIQIIEKPDLVLGIIDTIICVNESILQLEVEPPGGIWSGTGIDPLTGEIDLSLPGNGTHIYTYEFQPGTSCELSGNVEVGVIDLSGAINIGINEEICGGQSQFTLQTALPQTGQWSGPGIVDIQSGIIDLTLLNEGETYEYTYCVESANLEDCQACKTKTLTIHPRAIPQFEIPSNVCLNDTFELINNSINATSFSWNFGDGTFSTAFEPSHVYPMEGVFSIELIANSQEGCADTITQSITITAPPLSTFDVSITEGCSPLSVSVNNMSSGSDINFLWITGTDSTFQQNPTPFQLNAIYSDSIITIRLEVNNQCGLSIWEETVHVFPTPLADFGMEVISGCSPLEVNFQNSSLGNPETFTWDMGNGQVFNGQNPSMQLYTTTDSVITVYTVQLIAVNQCGIDTITREITVYPPDVTAFIELTELTSCQPATFNPSSYSTPGAQLSWEVWYDNNLLLSSQDRLPQFLLQDAGDYMIILQAANCGSHRDTAYFTVLPAPFVDFLIPLNPCQNTNVEFQNLSQPGGSVYWEFGDGNTSNQYNPIHQYLNPGVYPVSLTLNSSINGCPATKSGEITIRETPQAEFDPGIISGCPPLSVMFTNTSTGIGDLNSFWYFEGNQVPILDENPIYIFNQEGTHEIALIVTNEFQCVSDTFKQTVTVFPKPESNFDWDDQLYCHGIDSLHLINSSIGAISYVWELDGQQFFTNAPSILPENPGLINIGLISFNSFQCSDTTFRQLEILASPISMFSPSQFSGCPILSIDFLNQSEYSDRFQWSFGDSNQSGSNSPSHEYENTGEYQISLVASSGNGCPNDTSFQTITVFPVPDAAFNFVIEENCVLPAQVSFSNQSAGGTTFDWTFGDGNGSVLLSPLHTYRDTGIYNINLLVTNEYGCKDTLISSIEIAALPEANFDFPDNICERSELIVLNSSSFSRSFLWEISGVGTFTTVDLQFSELEPGTYDISLIAIFNDQCRDTLSLFQAINVHTAPIADFSYTVNESINLIGEVRFINESINASGYFWNFGDGSTGNDINPFHEYDVNGPLTVTLVASNDNSGLYTCLDTISKLIHPEWITTFYAPNAMAPEYGPGDVRYFVPKGLGIETLEISVYSPWGEQVWFSDKVVENSPGEFWDGTFRNQIVPQGAYAWIANIQFVNGVKRIEKGTVTVIR